LLYTAGSELAQEKATLGCLITQPARNRFGLQNLQSAANYSKIDLSACKSSSILRSN